jgi:hypothetical protein
VKPSYRNKKATIINDGGFYNLVSKTYTPGIGSEGFLDPLSFLMSAGSTGGTLAAGSDFSGEQPARKIPSIASAAQSENILIFVYLISLA